MEVNHETNNSKLIVNMQPCYVKQLQKKSQTIFLKLGPD